MTEIPPPKNLRLPLMVKDKLLMNPGPSNVPPRILGAMTNGLLSPLDSGLLEIMKETKEGIKYYFQTTNAMTFALSGTGHCAMETAICNILEKNDVFLVVKSGIWGERALDIGSRIGAKCHSIDIPIGEILTLDCLNNVMSKLQPTLLFVCHGDSSTGLLQPLEGIGSICKRYGCLFLVDGVASIGAVPVFMDNYCIDILYGGSQKVLSASPGISPISFSNNAMDKIGKRLTPVPSFYMDVRLVANYWSCDNKPVSYHHTGPVTLIYGLREALSILATETLEKSWARHKLCAKFLYDGLEQLGFEFLIAEKKYRLPTVTTVKIPYGINGKQFIDYLDKKFSISIGGGLGPTQGKVFRIGVMGFSCSVKNVYYLLFALSHTLQNFKSQSRL